MAKIFSILTLLAAALALYLGLESGKRIKELQSAGQRTQGKLVSTESDLKQTKATLETTEQNLAQTTADLEGTRAKLTTAEADLGTAKADLTAATQQIEMTKAELDKINEEIKLVLGEGVDLKTGISGLTAKITDLSNAKTTAETRAAELEKRVVDLDSQVKDLEQGKTAAEEKIAQQGTTIKRYSENIMQKGIRGRVMAVNSGWGFCVISVGDRQGAAANKIMIVARGGQAIGKVRITNVEANQSVADILPSTFVRGTYVQPGDEVIYTGDDKVKIDETPDAAPGATALPQPALPQ